MTASADLASVWAEERPRLTGLAYRILGSWHDAEDVVAQSWQRLASSPRPDRPEAWLTTVVTRLAIDSGRRARARREHYVGVWLPEPVSTDRLPSDVAEERSLLGLAMLRLMEQLEPEDRAIFVLREAFDVPYAEIADCVGRSPAACRQVVSRARATVRRDAPARPVLPDDQRLLTGLVNAVVDGEIGEVVRLISADCVLWSDGGGVVRAAPRPVVGRDRVQQFVLGVARLRPMQVEHHEVNGGPALLFTGPHGRYLYTIEHDGQRVTGIQVQANPDKLASITP